MHVWMFRERLPHVPEYRHMTRYFAVLDNKRHGPFDSIGKACRLIKQVSRDRGDTPEEAQQFFLRDSAVEQTDTLNSDLFTTGLASRAACFKYDYTNPLCATAASQTARVFNLATRRSLRQPLAGAAVAYAFARAGAIAWEAPTSPGVAGSPLILQAVGFDPSSLAEGPIETLDTGVLGASVHFTALTLEWTNAGQPQSVVLTNAS